jgi:hypothetical protein
MSRKVALKKVTKTEPKDIKQFLQQELMARDNAFVSKVELHYMKLVQWIVKMNSDALLDMKMPS